MGKQARLFIQTQGDCAEIRGSVTLGEVEGRSFQRSGFDCAQPDAELDVLTQTEYKVPCREMQLERSCGDYEFETNLFF
jgi:hypothetical protein